MSEMPENPAFDMPMHRAEMASMRMDSRGMMVY